MNESERLALVQYSAEALAKERAYRQSPAAAYIASLTTERSRKTARQSMQRITTVFGVRDRQAWISFPWERLGPAETIFIRAKLIETQGPSTVQLTLVMLRRILFWAVKLGYMSHEKWIHAVDWPRLGARTVSKGRSLEEEELTTLRAHLAELPGAYGALMTAIFAAGVGGGLRREELSTLSKNALSTDGSTLLVVGKGRKERTVSLLQGADADIGTWLAVRKTLALDSPTMFVALGADGRCVDIPISPEAMAHRIVKCMHDAGIQGAATHDLRRTYASRLLEIAPINIVQGQMGHESQDTTQLYDKRSLRFAAKMAKTLYAWGRPIATTESRETDPAPAE